MIQATPGHPFYILNDDGTRSHDELGQGWIRAKDLKAGDIILLLDGTRAIIESVESEQLDKPVKVYNFEVEDFHTYFVGHVGWLVHNKYCGSAAWKSENNSDPYHSFPSIIDGYATYYAPYRNGLDEYRVYGSYRGKDGYFQYYIDGDGDIWHRQFCPS